MRKLTFAAALLIGAASLQAQDAPTSSYSVTTDFTYASEYIFRGIEQQDHAFQPSVTFTSGPLTLGVWTSQAINHKFASWSEGSEIDVFGAWTIPISKYSLALGATYYWYPSARPSFGEPDSTWEPSVTFSGPLVGPLTFNVAAFHDFVLDSNTFQGGLGYSLPLPDEKGSFDVGVYYGKSKIDDGNGDLAGEPEFDYAYYGASVSVSYKLTEKSSMKVAVQYAKTDVDGLPKNLYFTVGVTTGL